MLTLPVRDLAFAIRLWKDGLECRVCLPIADDECVGRPYEMDAFAKILALRWQLKESRRQLQIAERWTGEIHGRGGLKGYAAQMDDIDCHTYPLHLVYRKIPNEDSN